MENNEISYEPDTSKPSADTRGMDDNESTTDIPYPSVTAEMLKQIW